MTSTASAFSIDADWAADLRPANRDERDGLVARLREELQEVEPVVGAAVLVSAAFRLRDEEALVGALRGLAEAVARFEHDRAEED